MAKTQLNLELSYKGKILDYIKNGSGVFKDKWFVGSNKYLLWQILDPAFPDKHQLIAQKGNDFFMKLVPGTKLECSKAGKQVDQAFLSSNGLLKGDQLQLQNDMSGTLVLNPDWQIHYRFIEPYVHILTEEERQIVAQYSRRAESSAEEKLGRGMILVFLFLTLALLVLYDLVLKPDAVDAATLDNTLAQLRKAQRVDMPDRSQDEADMQGDEAAEKARREEEARKAAEAAAAAAAAAGTETNRPQRGTTTGTPGGTGTNAAALFGEFNPNAVVRNPVAITTTRDFVAASRGGTGGTGGSGGTGGPDGSGGSGTSGGMRSTYDPNAIASYQQSDFSSASNTGGIKGSSVKPTGPVEVKGNLNQAQIAALGRPVALTSTDKAVINRISKEAPRVTENTIAQAPEGQQTDLQALRAVVNSRKGQLTSLYRKTAAIENSGGAVTIRIFGRGSNIETAWVTPTAGNLPQSFLSDVKKAVESWSVSGVSGPFDYEFTMRFYN